MKILIAEDDRYTQLLLKNLLVKWGYSVICVGNGIEAVNFLKKQEKPSLALIDWLMPEMTGIEVCKAVRKNNYGMYTYIILLTAKDTPKDIARGLGAGADDYIIKPFNKSELKSRLKAGIRIISYKRELIKSNKKLQEYSQNMEKLAKEKARQLIYADRMVLMGVMTSSIAHEINNSNTSIRLGVDLLKEIWSGSVQQILLQQVLKNKKDKMLSLGVKEGANMLDDIEKSSVRIENIVSSMKKFSYINNSNGKENIDIEECIMDAINLCLPMIKNITLEKKIKSDNRIITGSTIKITQIMVNLITNAADAVEKISRPKIKISLTPKDDYAHITVEDNGVGITEEEQKNLFDPFYTTKPAGKGTGLGLAISHEIVTTEQCGSLTVSPAKKKGSVFTLCLPYSQKNKKASPKATRSK